MSQLQNLIEPNAIERRLENFSQLGLNSAKGKLSWLEHETCLRDLWSLPTMTKRGLGMHALWLLNTDYHVPS